MRLSALFIASVAAIAGCGSEGSGSEGSESAFTSKQAVLMTFHFRGQVIAPASTKPHAAVKAQLQYTVGLLNGMGSAGRLTKIAFVSEPTSTPNPDGTATTSYEVKLPVAWGRERSLPKFLLRLPRKISSSGISAFIKKYSRTCNDGELDAITADNYWFHYRAESDECSKLMDEGRAPDILETMADVSESPENSIGKSPEYARIWSDGELRVVAVFGKDDEKSNVSDDPGIDAYNHFVGSLPSKLDIPAVKPFPTEPGVRAPDITFAQTFADGRKVTVTALLIDQPRFAPSSFWKRYDELTAKADLVLYNGHAGLGLNVQVLSKKGVITPGQYQIFYFNNCDTFAYLEDGFFTRRAEKNPDDPNGTKHLDILLNAMPGRFDNTAIGTRNLISGLLDRDHPKTYDDLLGTLEKSPVTVVIGEEDNR